MDRTSALNYILSLGKRLFRNRDLLAGIRGTSHDAADRNAVQEELMAIIEAAGLTPDANNWAQVLAGCRAMFGARGVWVTSSGNVTVPAGITRLYAEAYGGGGGGGGCSTAAAASAGGDGAGFAAGWFTVTPGQVIAVTIGAGGAAGNSSGTDGGNGGTTTLGSLLTATGGKGGKGSTTGAAINLTSAPGAGSGGDVGVGGLSGSNGVQIGSNYFAGQGGPSPFGSFTRALAASGAGENGQLYGGGGGGAAAGAYAGGTGAPGVVRVAY
jgi:hypothetical protein